MILKILGEGEKTWDLSGREGVGEYETESSPQSTCICWWLLSVSMIFSSCTSCTFCVFCPWKVGMIEKSLFVTPLLNLIEVNRYQEIKIQ